MAKIPKKISTVLKNYIQDLKKYIIINKAFLFGSYSSGDFDENSDIDIAVFSSDFRGKKSVDATTFLFKIARKYPDYCIEPIGFMDQDLDEENPFIKQILDTGEEIIV